MRRYKSKEGLMMVGSIKTIGRYLIARGRDVDNPGMARFAILLKKNEQKLYKSEPMSPLRARKLYDETNTLRKVEALLI